MAIILFREIAEAIAANAVQLTGQPDPTQLHKCYNIPYGVFGFFPKLIAYFSVVVALAKPGLFADEDDGDGEDRQLMGMVLFLGTLVTWLFQFIPAALMIHECRGEYRMLAIWKATATFSDLFAQNMLRCSGRYTFFSPIMALLALLLLPGLVPGIIALRRLVEQNWHLPGVRSATWAYSVFAILNVVMLFVAGVSLGIMKLRDGDRPGKHTKMVCLMLTALPAILPVVAYYMMAGYADWVIAVTVNNIGGLPFKKDAAISYFLGSLADAALGFI